jgi:hypothetical protein
MDRMLGKACRDTGLAGAGRAGEQDAAAAEETSSTQHGVQPGNAGGDPSGRNLVVQAERGDRQHADAVVADEEGELVRAVERAAILHHAQVARGDLIVDPMIEQDDAIGHVLFEAVTGQLLAPRFGGDHCRHALGLEPAEQPAQLGAQDRLVGQAGEERFERVQHHAFGADRVDRVIQPDEESFQVVLAGLLDLAALDVHVLEHELLATHQGRQVESEGRDVALELRVGLFERHEHARLVELRRPTHEKFRSEQRLAAPSAAAHERRPPTRKPATRQLVEAPYAGGALR